jgi:CRISPR-associated protein Cmr6
MQTQRPETEYHLIQRLAEQHERRGQTKPQFCGLLKQGTFVLSWRAKVGSFAHPDGETLVSAGEPWGTWRPEPEWAKQNPPLARDWRPEGDRNLGHNLAQLPTLPLNGYIPGSAIRGIVRTWAQKRTNLKSKMENLLGCQEGDTIRAGKVEFLDAWPQNPTQLTLDIVNPQQEFQVHHQGQGTPLSCYTLGNGQNKIPVTVAIRGIPGRITEGELQDVWDWVCQALSDYGVGSRTAAGYGQMTAPPPSNATRDPHCAVRELEFSLYSQGCSGPDPRQQELRPSHWRGWLHSWLLRFFLGVMSERDAITTVGELLGVLEPETRQGCVRLSMERGSQWGKDSTSEPDFYYWQGCLTLSTHKDTAEASENLLNKIILPILRFAVMVGGVGRGWRRPLHIYWQEQRDPRQDAREASRGTYLKLTCQVNSKAKLFNLPLKPETWNNLYTNWCKAVQKQWPQRFKAAISPIEAEIFSPTTCAIYCVPGPEEEPLIFPQLGWKEIEARETRGEGMELIYKPAYKRKREVGGNAGNGAASCSWVSIKRVNIPHKTLNTNCQEIVCLFLGENNSRLRSQFLRNLAAIPGANHLFGIQGN